jgi:hypothetical protein
MTKAFGCLFGLLLLLSAWTWTAQAQMPTVGITGITHLQGCPAGVGFYTSNPNYATSCTQCRDARSRIPLRR